jgi:hypothetical protein
VFKRSVLEQIQSVTRFANEHEQAFVELLRQSDAEKFRKELAQAKQNRIAELDHYPTTCREDSVARATNP